MRVCQFRHFGKSDSRPRLNPGAGLSGENHITFYRCGGTCQTSHLIWTLQAAGESLEGTAMQELFLETPPQAIPVPASHPLELTFEPYQTRIFWLR